MVVVVGEGARVVGVDARRVVVVVLGGEVVGVVASFAAGDGASDAGVGTAAGAGAGSAATTVSGGYVNAVVGAIRRVEVVVVGSARSSTNGLVGRGLPPLTTGTAAAAAMATATPSEASSVLRRAGGRVSLKGSLLRWTWPRKWASGS